MMEPQSKPPPEDRRVRRTKERLRQALLQLLLEKPYKNISVQNILDLADVSRAAFYAHYQGKDELLMAGLPDNVLHHGTWESDDLLPPVTALFQHIVEGQAWVQSMQGTAVMQMIRGRMVENWLAHFARLEGTEHELTGAAEPVAHYLTGALMSLLLWWVSNGMQASPEEMNELFQQLARQGISGLTGAWMA
jgi:AcrR family transcriptional regulator